MVVKEGVSIAIALLFLVNDPPPRLASPSPLLCVFNVVFFLPNPSSHFPSPFISPSIALFVSSNTDKVKKTVLGYSFASPRVSGREACIILHFVPFGREGGGARGFFLRAFLTWHMQEIPARGRPPPPLLLLLLPPLLLPIPKPQAKEEEVEKEASTLPRSLPPPFLNLPFIPRFDGA